MEPLRHATGLGRFAASKYPHVPLHAEPQRRTEVRVCGKGLTHVLATRTQIGIDLVLSHVNTPVDPLGDLRQELVKSFQFNDDGKILPTLILQQQVQVLVRKRLCAGHTLSPKYNLRLGLITPLALVSLI
jgi:hypothetical protein